MAQIANGVDFLLVGGKQNIHLARANKSSNLINKLNIYGVLSDPRVADWPLMGSPIPLLVILSIYLFVVYVVGPA